MENLNREKFFDPTNQKILIPKTVEEAIYLLGSSDLNIQAVSGATWLMRASLRDEDMPSAMVSLKNIKELQQVVVESSYLDLGACLTHEQVANNELVKQNFNCLRQAAIKSANPTIRTEATLGGNICSVGFFASDLVPALLALDATILLAKSEVSDTRSIEKSAMPIEKFLSWRSARQKSELVYGIRLKNEVCYSAHARITMMEAGDYPVANLSCVLSLTEENKIAFARIAVGSVENVAKRWFKLESALVGMSFDIPKIKTFSKSFLNVFVGRDYGGTPGWYRVEIIPKLIEMALFDVSSQILRTKESRCK